MSVLSSLTNRLFAAMALLAVVSIAAAMYYATAAVTAQAEGELRRDVDEAGALVEEYRALIFEHFAREARLVADLPRLKAAVAENHAPTLAPIAEEYRAQLGADLLVVVNPQGAELARTGTAAASGILEVVSTPIAIRAAGTEFLGTLKVGFSLDARTAARFKELTNSEIAFGRDGAIRVATLPKASWPVLAALLATPGITRSVSLGETDFIAATRVLRHQSDGGSAAGAPSAIVMRSRTERLQFLSRVHATVLLMAVGAVLLATLASYAIARTVTGPLGAVTAEMRNMAATGDLTRRISLTSGARWEDEDARLLATTFNSMTDAIARFQREAAQRERLSALGRLSTVVAHEIRNPLMIIKTTLRGLRRQEVAAAEVQAAVADIDEEVTRLDHIVSEVLDFARPIRFELAPVDLNALCADAARAVWPDGEPGGGAGARLDLATGLPPVVTDAERLRLALVNVLTNARQATDAGEGEPPPARLSTCRLPRNRVGIDVRDDGIGLAPEDQTRMFDPFFTTRRTGTGLGLAITRNIIEGLGGTITISSRPGEGTDVHIELPVDRAAPGMHP